jgi:hypothetical protein
LYNFQRPLRFKHIFHRLLCSQHLLKPAATKHGPLLNSNFPCFSEQQSLPAAPSKRPQTLTSSRLPLSSPLPPYKYSSINVLKLPTRAYTPGNPASAHPVPQLTAPITVPCASTIGPPLSPWHESLPPASYPAHTMFSVTSLGGLSAA